MLDTCEAADREYERLMVIERRRQRRERWELEEAMARDGPETDDFGVPLAKSKHSHKNKNKNKNKSKSAFSLSGSGHDRHDDGDGDLAEHLGGEGAYSAGVPVQVKIPSLRQLMMHPYFTDNEPQFKDVMSDYTKYITPHR